MNESRTFVVRYRNRVVILLGDNLDEVKQLGEVILQTNQIKISEL